MNNADPGRGRVTTFIARITDNCIRTMIEGRKAGKRSCNVPVDFLDDEIDADTATSRHEIVDQETYLLLTGRISRPLLELHDLEIDVAAAADSLPLQLREIARLLVHDSISEVARRTGIPRTTITEKRNQIRRIFEKRGIGEYP